LGFAGLVGYNFSSNHFHHYTNSIIFILQLSFCLLFLNKIFNHPPKQLLIKNPIFLIVSGLLIKCAIAIPIHLALVIMYVGKQSAVYLYLFPLANIMVITMYVHFIYAFICIKKEYNNIIDFNPKIQ
jgi:hypothetical protein